MGKLLAGVGLFLFGQILIWYQTNGQFKWEWCAKNPFAMALIFSIPISFAFIVATKYVVGYFDGTVVGWLVGFAVGEADGKLVGVHVGGGEGFGVGSQVCPHPNGIYVGFGVGLELGLSVSPGFVGPTVGLLVGSELVGCELG